MKEGPLQIPAWALPLIVLALAVPIIAGFAIGGPGVGLAVGALAAVALIVIAARARPQGPIAPPSGSGRRRILLAAGVPVDEPAAVERIAAEAGIGGEDEPAQVRVLVPARSRFLDRWASDVRPAREAAQDRLVHTLASFGKAHIEADARVGDADLVQAVEDELRTFPATEVILATGEADDDPEGNRAAEELGARLSVPFRHLKVPAPPR